MSNKSPERWQSCRLGDVFSERKEPGLDGLPTLTVTISGGIRRREELDRRIVSELEPERHLLARSGDIVYNMMRMWQGASGLAREDGLVSPAYVVITPSARLLPEFAATLLKSPRMIRLLHGYSQGVTGDRLRLYFQNFANIPVSLPPIPEQQKIAEILTSIDEAIQANQAVIMQTQKAQHGLQGDLLAPCALTTINREQPPRGWRLIRLGDIFTERTEPGEGGLPVLTVALRHGIKRREELGRRIASELEPHQHLRVRPGDIAYNMMRMWQGASGLVGEDGMISPAYVVAIPTSAILPEFAAVLFKSPSMIRLLHGYSQGVTGDRLRLYYEQFATIPIALPSLEEQQQSVRTLAPFSSVVRMAEQQLDAMQRVKTEVASYLLSGRKRVEC